MFPSKSFFFLMFAGRVFETPASLSQLNFSILTFPNRQKQFNPLPTPDQLQRFQGKTFAQI